MILALNPFHWQFKLSPKWNILFVFGLHLGITLFLAISLNIWLDEAYSLHATEQKSMANFFYEVIVFGLRTPFYFVLLKLWRNISDNIIFARLLSTLFTFLALYVIYLVGIQCLPRRSIIWFTLIFALNPWIIWTSLEIREYSLVLLIESLLFLFLIYSYFKYPDNRFYRIIYISLSIAALYTYYYLAFVLFANGVSVFCIKGYKAIQKYILDMIISGICFLPLFLFASAQVSETIAQITNVEKKSVLTRISHSVVFVIRRLFEYVFSLQEHEFYQYKSLFIGLIFIIILLSTIGILLIKKRRNFSLNLEEKIFAWINLSLILIVFLIRYRMQHGGILTFRHTLILLVPLLLFLFSITHSVLKKINLNYANKRRIKICLVMILLLCNFRLLIMNYSELAKEGDFKRVAHYIMKNEQKNQAITALENWVILPFSYHYKGINPMIPIPHSENFKKFDPLQFQITSSKQVLKSFQPIRNKNIASIWYIKHLDFCAKKINQKSCKTMDSFIDQYYTIKIAHEFYKTEVKLLEQKNSFPP